MRTIESFSHFGILIKTYICDKYSRVQGLLDAQGLEEAGWQSIGVPVSPFSHAPFSSSPSYRGGPSSAIAAVPVSTSVTAAAGDPSETITLSVEVFFHNKLAAFVLMSTN